MPVKNGEKDYPSSIALTAEAYQALNSLRRMLQPRTDARLTYADLIVQAEQWTKKAIESESLETLLAGKP